MKVYVAWSVDHLEGLTAAALMSNNVEELRRISGDIRRASENIKAWAMASGGSPVLDLSILGVVMVPPDKMTELPSISQRFRDISEGSISIGVGMALSEAYIAMKHSQTGGGDRISLYDPSMEEHQEPAPADPQAALQALGKADGQNQQQPEDPQDQVTGYADNPSDFGLDGDDIYADANTAEQATEQASSASSASASAMEPPKAMSASQPQQGGQQEQAQGDEEDPRTAVVQALEKIKQQAPVLEQMKTTNPQAFDAVKSVVAAMILMAQGMAAEMEDGDEEKEVNKSEPSDLVQYLESDDGHEHEWGKDEAGDYCLKCGSDKEAIELAKAGLPMPKATPKRIVHPWPVGTVKEGKVKVAHVDPNTNAQTGTGWKEVRAGMVMAPDGHPTSSRNPNGQ